MTDQEQQIIDAARAIIRPSYSGDIVDWCEQNVTEVPDSPIRGRLNLSRTPWVAEALRIASDPETKVLSIIACTQSGKSLFARLFTCWAIVNSPAHMMLLTTNDPEAKDWMLRYVRPLFKMCPPVAALLSDEDNDKSTTADFKNNVTLYCRGAWNENNLQRLTLRRVIMDETWLYPKGHIGEASARTQTFSWMGQVIAMSQGAYEGDETTTLFNSTDKRSWCFACVKCGAVQPWLWDYVRLPETAKLNGVWDLKQVEAGTTYECAHCQHRMPDTPGSRAEANRIDRGAGFRASTQSSSIGSVGLHWNCLANSSWGKEAVSMLRAKEAYTLYDDSEQRRVWKQKRLAQAWSDDGGEIASQAEAGDYALGDPWDKEAWVTPDARVLDFAADLPAGSIPFRTLAADMQRGHMWAEVRSWSKSGHSRLRWWGKLDTWQQLDDLAAEHKVNKAFCGVDCGDQTQEVYAQTALRGWKALRGSGQTDFTVQDAGGKTTKRFYSDKQFVFIPGQRNRAEMIVWSNLQAKDMLAGLQKRRLHTYGRNVPDDYTQQLTSEIRVKDARSGKAHWILPSNKTCGNHAWDCALMGLILAVRWGIIGREATETAVPTQPAE